MGEGIQKFDNQGSFTGFAYACKEWGWTILDAWEIEDGYAAVRFATND